MKSLKIRVTNNRYSPRIFAFLIILIWAVTVFSRLKYNGLVYGFDYGVYQPDGVHYAYRAFTFAGIDPISAAQKVSEWYSTHSFKIGKVIPESLLPENNAVWSLVSPRLLYPILSAPFALILGVPGMLVVPCLSLLVLYFTSFKIVSLFSSNLIGLFGVIFLSASSTLNRWMISNCTDSLLAGLFAVVAWKLYSKKFEQKIYAMSALIFLTSMTRISLPIWCAIAFVFYKSGKKKMSFVILLESVIFSVPTFIASNSSNILPASQNKSILGKILELPYSFIKITFFEFSELLVLDRILFLILICAIFISIRNLRSLQSQLFLTVLFATFFIGAINGSIGVNFRYQLPSIIFGISSISDFIRSVKIEK